MEQSEYRAQVRDRKTTVASGATAGVSGLISVGAHDWVISAAALDLTSTPTLITYAAGGAIGAVAARRRHRASDRYRFQRMLHAKGWMHARDMVTHTGRAAMVRQAKKTRHDLGNHRFTASGRDLGVFVGRAISGSVWLRRGRKIPGTDLVIKRGASVFASYEAGLLVLGEPGSWKTAYLTNQVIDNPGPLLVTSTKTEFWSAVAPLREANQGPVWIYDPYGLAQPEQHHVFRWNLVAGCRNIDTAMQRAEALMAAAAGDGVKNATFFEGRARNLFTALLTAADLMGKTLRDVAQWVMTETYDQPRKILERAARDGVVSDLLPGFLKSLTDSSAGATSGSAAQTASSVLEFLANPAMADALCPAQDGTSFDFEDMIDRNGTLFLVTGESKVLAPIASVIAAEVRKAAKRVANRTGVQVRLAPPLGLIYDEAPLTMGGVPIHQHVAELRSTGVFHIVAAQNYSQLEATWGEEEAKDMAGNLRNTLVLAANQQDDRERYTKRIGQRLETHVKVSRTRSQDVETKIKNALTFGLAGFGTSENVTPEQVSVDRFPVGAWSELEAGQAVLITPLGRPAVVAIDHGLIRAEKLRAKLAAADEAAKLREARGEHLPTTEPASTTSEATA